MPSKIIKIVIELMFMDVNMFLALLITHSIFMCLSRAKNIFTPANINSGYCYIVNFVNLTSAKDNKNCKN